MRNNKFDTNMLYRKIKHIDDENRRKSMKRFVNYYDKHGALTLESFDPELAEWINTGNSK